MPLSPSVDVNDDDDDKDDEEEAIASENILQRLCRSGRSRVASASVNLTSFTDLRQSSITSLLSELTCVPLTIFTDVCFVHFRMPCLGIFFSRSRGFPTLSPLLLLMYFCVPGFLFVLLIFPSLLLP